MAIDGGAVRVLVTGGAGFLGSHVVDALLKEGHKVAVYDSLVEQVHGDLGNGPLTTTKGTVVRWPEWCRAWNEVELWRGDVRDPEHLRSALASFRPDVVVHLAAEVGVGQAERAIERYVDANVRGTAVLLEAILAVNATVEGKRGIRRLVVAGSMSSYGEGLWFCPEHGTIRQQRRDVDVAAGGWTPACPHDGCRSALEPTLTPEWSSLRPAGVYSATKRDQEEYALLVGRSTGLSVAVARFFNLYGPRQALGNPYTGVCAIFAARCMAGLAPRVYEDGGQVRDFVHVSDAASAVLTLVGPSEIRSAAREWASSSFGGVFNIGTGIGTTVLDVAELACEVIAPHLRPEVTGIFRIGDVRACVAEPKRMIEGLGWQPRVEAHAGLSQLFRGWMEAGAPAVSVERLEAAHNEADELGVLLGGEVVVVDDAAPAAPAWDATTGQS